MELQNQTLQIPPAPPAGPPNSELNHLPQNNGASLSTSIPVSTAASQASFEESVTPGSSSTNLLHIPKLSAATVELLARTNGMNRQKPISDSSIMSSCNNTAGTPCSTRSESNGDLSAPAASGNGKKEVREGTKYMSILSSQSSISQQENTLDSTTSMDITTQQQPPLATPGPTNVYNAVRSPDSIAPTMSSPTLANNMHLRKIAPHPASTPLATSTSGSKQQRTTTTNLRRSGRKGAKRRKMGRNKASDDDDGIIKASDTSSDESSDEATPVIIQTKSGRQIHRPTVFVSAQTATGSGSPTAPDAASSPHPRKRRRVYRKGKEVNVVCRHCERGHSPTGNVIVFCDDCNRPWHQFCHDPPIEKELVTMKELEWFCKECRPVETSSHEIYPPSAVQQVTVNRIDTSNHVSTIPSETRVGGAQFSPEQKQGYLSSLSHAHLVNILLDISNSTPDLPIFPENLLDLPSSTLPQTTLHAPTTQPRTSNKPPFNIGESSTSVSTLSSQNSLTTPQSSIAGHPHPPPISVPVAAEENNLALIPNNEPSDEDENEDEEYMYIEDHRLYPRPGNGFRLPPDSEDLDMLLEDPAWPTFSHSLHGSVKVRMETGGLPIVVGDVA
ncbi:uncharacterized protein PADG_00609 [Paracoccidioides brasiliensis Pb18]|uniref:PHD-type domain-containing protein n=1 Tax=Paracoccidioides brasiliensis (strain Pb18) TaxID=502780 RepID=C1G169_PARBD|nr:uncharacterized protein PADG_00609 [Paracoccidioides brasiliensis Pb18]EEH44320.1 hypothetical protein PADG_00609 [Paracoccidioides brasiliensis Pb18]